VNVRWLAISVALGNLLVPLNSTMIVVALPQVARDLQVDVAQTSWIITSYLIAMAALQPIAGRVGDRLGRRNVMLAALVYFALASAGALGGLAGALMLLGEQYTLKDGFSSGYGFDGLVAGLLARGSVTGVAAAALLFGFMRSGGINMEMVAAVPTALVVVIQGLIVITLAGATLFIEKWERK